MERKIVYLINPISGTRGKSSLQELIARRTRERGINFSILPTDAEGRYEFLTSLIRQEQVTDIVICGGDGTISAVAAALAGTEIRVGIIPMGSGNGLALAAGIPLDPDKALDLIFEANASHIDAFTINGCFSCMLCGIGFDAHVAHEFARQSSRGLQTYIRVTLRHFFSMKPYPFRIRSGESSFPVDAFFISVANGNQFGNNFTIAPKASLDDGMLDIVIARKTNKLHLLLSVIRQVLGGNGIQDIRKEPGKKQILYFRTSGLIIENPAGAPLHIDGDPAATDKEFIIRIVPRVFRLIHPAS